MQKGISKVLKGGIYNFLQWKSKYISQRNFLIVLSILIGIVAALAAVALKRTAIFMEELLAEAVHDSFLKNSFFLYPIIGIVLSVLVVRWLLKGKMEKGVGYIIYAIAKKRSYLDKSNIWSHLLTSALTVSMGGSVGVEAPIVGSGAAIGSNVGRWFLVGYQERTLLLASGAAAGIAAIFNAPLAGMIFALEVLILNFSLPFIIPIIISTVTASVVSQILFPGKFFYQITSGWEVGAVPFYVLLGIIVGLLSVYMIRTTLFIEHRFMNYKPLWKRVVLAAVPLCVLIFLFPPLFGEGYIIIELLLEGADHKLVANSIFAPYLNNAWWILLFAVLVTVFKVITAALTVSAGGNGGVFGPAMFAGGMVGYVFSRFVNLTGFYGLAEPNFIVAGMAGIIAGVIHAPLTGIFLIAEVTGGYALFIPLMIVSAVSYFVTRAFERHSIYHKQLVEEGIISKKDTEGHIL